MKKNIYTLFFLPNNLSRKQAFHCGKILYNKKGSKMSRSQINKKLYRRTRRKRWFVKVSGDTFGHFLYQSIIFPEIKKLFGVTKSQHCCRVGKPGKRYEAAGCLELTVPSDLVRYWEEFWETELVVKSWSDYITIEFTSFESYGIYAERNFEFAFEGICKLKKYNKTYEPFLKKPKTK